MSKPLLYGVLGWPVAHSRSPAMHNAAFRALELDALYVPIAVPPERLPAMIESLRAFGVAGVNVTLPHKTAVMPLLDDLTAAARAVSAVNTILVRDGKLIGDNTDAEGLTRSLRASAVQLAGANAVVLGAGGAARAAVYGLAIAGASRIAIAARAFPEAERLVRELAPMCSAALRALPLDAELATELARCTLLIQSTSATLGSDSSSPEIARSFAASLPLAALPAHAAVCDLVNKPLQTTVLAAARARGLHTVDGLGMLLHQGALAFERWTGKPAPISVMREALT